MSGQNGFLGGFLNFLKSKEFTEVAGTAETVARIAKYMGVITPGQANLAYAMETIQKSVAGAITGEETVGRLAGAATSWLTTEGLEALGVWKPLAALIGDAVSVLVAEPLVKAAAGAGLSHLKVGQVLASGSGGPTHPSGINPTTAAPGAAVVKP